MKKFLVETYYTCTFKTVHELDELSEKSMSEIDKDDGVVEVIDVKDIDATKITSDWFLWIHHTINETPTTKTKKYNWQKRHTPNLSGTKSAYKPNKISKRNVIKNYETWKN